MEETLGRSAIDEALSRARDFSPFLKLQRERLPLVDEMLCHEGPAAALELVLAAPLQPGQEGVQLRRMRSGAALALGIGDLSGSFPLERVVETLSDLADRALQIALEAVIDARTPGASARGFAIIALGKHGSRELNYSSDVDLQFLYDPEILPVKPREEPAQAAVRIGKAIIEMLQARTGEGYVFRVDMRLRPSPEVTPIALPVEAAIAYYESSALAWERAAFIRARVAAGDRALGAYFLEAIHPFVWRRSLDFGAVDEILSITRRIRDHYAQGQTFGPGFDLKRGRGGIREIEFFAQIHQLIHGGRDPALRVQATMPALAALAEAGRITQDDAAAMAAAYRLYRTIEHRLQMVDDLQTHSLPEDRAALDNVARLHGLSGGDALIALLAPHVERVAAIYDSLRRNEAGTGLPTNPTALAARLAQLGFDDVQGAGRRIAAWRSGGARSLRTSAAREAFDAMLPGLVEAFGQSPDPMRAMNRFDDIVERLPSGINLYRLIHAQPVLAGIVASILAHAPTLAEQLAGRPQLLDGLIDASAFDPVPEQGELVAEFARPERAGEDYQMMLDRVRKRVNERRFALGAQVVTGRGDPQEVARGYSRVAEAAICVLASAAVAEFEGAHGRVPGSELVIVGLGRLGGGALTHASDLDLVYLFTGSHEGGSDGAKPLGATDYFNRLARRVTAALSVPTVAGPLYQVDTRLRPSGSDGLLAVSVPSFAAYHREQAWTWEHLALTRARPVHGSPEARREVEAIVAATLRRQRDSLSLVSDAARMRGEIARHKPPAGPFDVKLGDGGLVDLEFAVQTLALCSGVGLDPHTDRAVEQLAAAGLVPSSTSAALGLLTRMLVTLRLVCPDSGEPPIASRSLVARACGLRDWGALLAAHDAARQEVAALWRSVTKDAK